MAHGLVLCVGLRQAIFKLFSFTRTISQRPSTFQSRAASQGGDKSIKNLIDLLDYQSQVIYM